VNNSNNNFALTIPFRNEFAQFIVEAIEIRKAYFPLMDDGASRSFYDIVWRGTNLLDAFSTEYGLCDAQGRICGQGFISILGELVYWLDEIGRQYPDIATYRRFSRQRFEVFESSLRLLMS
jgi:hypothetical protein